MAENVTNELLLEHMKDLQARFAAFEQTLKEIKADNQAHRSITSGNLQSVNLQGEQIAHLQLRLDRIERRLSLSDG